MACPYCESEDPCDHLLLMIDRSEGYDGALGAINGLLVKDKPDDLILTLFTAAEFVALDQAIGNDGNNGLVLPPGAAPYMREVADQMRGMSQEVLQEYRKEGVSLSSMDEVDGSGLRNARLEYLESLLLSGRFEFETESWGSSYAMSATTMEGWYARRPEVVEGFLEEWVARLTSYQDPA